MSEFDEFDNDDDFANFDLDAVVASHTPSKRPQEDSGASNDPNKRSKPPVGMSNSCASVAMSPDATGSNPAISQQDEHDAILANELEAIPAQFQNAMAHTLQRHFGHSTFRPGQLTILYSLLGDGGNGSTSGNQPKDACVFWATGAGKSLCYQAPPLHLNEVAIVITPLVSLMQDQCAKLNGRVGNDMEIATYLGSSQSNYQAEEKALNGEYRLVYVTPEKLVGGGGVFLDRLARMHQLGGKGRICLIAVDESHCVSEWGHDFRPEFLRIGSSLRTHPVLSSIPLLALTATAVPRVQKDIRRNLRMHSNATIAKRSFDRPNLKITIKRKPKNGVLGAFEQLVKEMAKIIVQQKNTTKGIPGKSTIVYVSTKREVEEVTQSIISNLAHHLVRLNGNNTTLSVGEADQIASVFVRAYHAGFSHSHRTQAHTDFLIGKASIIVATVAFGMGIDKPDIRRVFHWGACKTVEEYYQQMGRAGRDGLKAECTMFCEASDFSKFQSDFYLGSLSGEAKLATIRSMDALKDFAMSTEGCRRASLLKFFDETPLFGNWCGTCDLCLARKNYVDDFERDFQWEGARVLLLALAACPGEALSTLETVIKGGTVDANKYVRNQDVTQIKFAVQAVKGRMKKKKPVSYFREFLPALIDRGYVKQSTKSSRHKYSKAWSVYTLTKKGNDVVGAGPIMLPVPVSIREAEQLEEEKRKQALAELQSAGVDLAQIPEEELESGEGEAIAALKHWFTFVDSLQKRGLDDKVNELDDLRSRIEAWRLDMAERYRMAPASVMEEHLLVKIAYATASLRTGRMERDALVAAGVRSNGIDELTAVLGDWSEQVQKGGTCEASDSKEVGDSPMTFKPGDILKPVNSWRYAVYKPNKKTGMAAWEASYNRFTKGEHMQTIAVTQASGKPIQVATVISHILDAIAHGRCVDLHRLSSAEQPPTKSEWDDLVRCELTTGMDVTADPATSGPNGDRWSMKDFLVPVMGNSFVLKDFKDRTPKESAKFSKWCAHIKWYLAFRRASFEPTFGEITEINV